MKLQVLVDNMTYIDQYYLGEPGVSYYLEDEGQSFLFDTGYSDVCIRNAQTMGISLETIHGIILSHGHNDHSGGLVPLRQFYARQERRQIPLIAHPQAFAQRRCEGQSIGSPLCEKELAPVFSFQARTEPVWLTKHLVYLGEIPRTQSFENQRAIGERLEQGQWIPDYVPDDTALTYCSAQGLVVITGCSHAGICNIVERARRVCREPRIAAVIGGFHLMHPSQDTLAQTIAYFKRIHPDRVYAAHCIDFPSKCALAAAVPVTEVGVNLHLSWEA